MKSTPEMSILSIIQSTISFWTDTLNIDYFVHFNNFIWIDILCTRQSENDVFHTTNIVWIDLSLCNEHFLKP